MIARHWATEHRNDARLSGLSKREALKWLQSH